MMGTLWDSINLALIVAYLVAVHVALHTSHNMTKQRLGNATTTPNAKPANKHSTTPTTANKQHTYAQQPPPATYATYPSNQATTLRQIISNQETPTAHYNPHTDYATNVEATPHYPTNPPHQHTGTDTTNKQKTNTSSNNQ